MGTRIQLNGVRLSYVHLIEPRAVKPGDTPKYGAALLLPKTDPAIAQIQAAELAEIGNTWGASPPPTLKPLPMYDGDIDPRYNTRPECRGMMVLNTGNYDPIPVTSNANPGIPSDPAIIYSGCYANVFVSLFTYGTKPGAMSKGVTFGLDGVMFIADGERLDNRPTLEQMFGSIDGAPPPVAAGVIPAGVVQPGSPGAAAAPPPMQQQPMQQPVLQQPVQQPMQPVQQPVQQPMQPVQQPMQPVQQPVQQPMQQPMQQPVNPGGQATQAPYNPVQPPQGVQPPVNPYAPAGQVGVPPVGMAQQQPVQPQRDPFGNEIPF